MTDEESKAKVLGGAGNPNKLIELRNKGENSGYIVASGGYNSNKVIELRNEPNVTTISTYNPVTKKISIETREEK